MKKGYEKIIQLVANWKMNLGVHASSALAERLATLSKDLQNTQLGIAPQAACLPACHLALNDSPVRLGAQNVGFEKTGAYTGELSPEVALESGAMFSIIGHSERRNIFKEDESLCAKRTLAALSSGLAVVFCVGETLEERNQGATFQCIQRQLAPLKGLIEVQAKMTIAYEPVWAIGTGLAASSEQIAEVHNGLAELWREISPSKCPAILYGGSVNQKNFAEIVSIDAVAGALVGAASTTFETFRPLIEIAERMR